MSAIAPLPAPPPAQLDLPPGTLISDRFEIEACTLTDQLGSSYAARDRQTRKPATLFVLSTQLASQPAIVARIHETAQAALGYSHAGLVAVYAEGIHEDLHYIAREALVGRSASALIAERKAQGRTLSLRGVYNLIAHVCKAISALPAGTAHGALRPSIVWVTKSGRVKVADTDLGSALATLGRVDLMPSGDQAFLAPEVKRGEPPDARSDVFGVGALLYALLTARSPLDAFVIPSQLRPDASPQLDAVMMRCLAADPSQRFGSVNEVVRVIMPLVAAAPVPENDDFEVDVEVDVDVAMSIAPPALRNTSMSLLPIDIESLPAPPKPPPTAAGSEPGDPLAEATARLTANDGPRWIAVKNGMDHGPFTARELIKLIVDGEVVEQNLVFNMSSSERKTLGEHGEFAPFIQQYRIRRDEKEHAEALVRSNKVEKRSNAAKLTILAASIGAIALLGGGYFMNRKAAGERKRSESDLAALYESGQVRISGTAGILKIAPPRAGGKRASGGTTGTSPGGFASYEDAMNQAVELNVGKAGGERQLTSSDVAGVMNRELNRLFGCVGEELRRGGKLGHVGIDMAIMGNGRVAGASVNAGSPGFQRCIAAKLREVHFPDFPAPRMGARYSFNVD
ncbi:MAG: protein kinase [Polyangiales bacterium]